MRIVIVTEGLAFHGHTLQKEAMGGSETAVICMAAAMAEYGHKVSVYCLCPAPGVYDGVEYHHVRDFDSHMLHYSPDVLIASRWFGYLARGVRAGLNVMWCHDMPAESNQVMPNACLADIAFMLSEYQKKQYEEKIPDLKQLLRVTRNGLTEDLRGLTPNIDMSNNDVIYSSRPERGLLELLRDVMPAVWKSVPNARLKVATYFNELPAGQGFDHVNAIHRECQRLIASYGERVVNLGGLTKEQLYVEMKNSAVLAYPTAWPEISCLTLQEIQACGTPCLCTDDFALSETANPIARSGKQLDPDFYVNFANRVVAVLKDKDLRVKLADAGLKHVKDNKYFWKDIASEWIALFAKSMEERASADMSKIVDSFILENDYGTAELISENAGMVFDHEYDSASEANVHTVMDRIEESRKTFQAVETLLSNAEGSFAKVLCVPNGVECQSYWLAGALPESDVVVMAENESHKKSLESAHSKSGNPARVVLVEDLKREASSENGKFDVLVISKRVEQEKFYQNYLQSMQKNFLRKTGKLALVCSFGESLLSKHESCYRYWRIGLVELQEIFEPVADTLRVCPVVLGKGRNGNHYGALVSVSAFCANPKKFSLSRKIHSQRPYQNVSLCMLVGNDRHWLPQALHSAAKHVDEILVYDTKDSQDTKYIVEEYPHARWIPGELDNFGQARNASKLEAKGDWVLWFDCDERLVNPERIRKHLPTHVFHGFAIKQNHWLLDGQIDPDVPVRLFRNRKEVMFRGCVHEHPEDTTLGDYDTPIHPSMLMTGVDIAHFGYVNESIRRAKCSRRNMALLLRDVEENGKKGRMLTWVLVARDYVNMAKWEAERTGGRIEYGGISHVALEAAIQTYWAKTRSTDTYASSADNTYRDALLLMAKNNLPYRPLNSVPFCANVTIEAIPAEALGKDYKPQVEIRPFLCHQEYHAYVLKKSTDSTGHRLNSDPWVLDCELPEPASILQHASGMNMDRVAA